MKELIIPQALKQGDTLAAITLSFGAAGRFPNRYQQGVRQIEESFGVKVVPTPHALCSSEDIYTHPDWWLYGCVDDDGCWDKIVLLPGIGDLSVGIWTVMNKLQLLLFVK